MVPEGFRVSSLEPVGVDVEVDAPSGEAYPDAAVHLLDSKGREIETRGTGDDGRVHFRAPSGDGTFRVYVTAVGIPSDTVDVPAHAGLVVLPRQGGPIAAAEENSDAPLLARTLSWASPSSSSQGVPAGLDSSRRSEITASFLSDVNFAFPEGVKIPNSHPEYLQQGAVEEILLSDSGEMWLTFIHEGAGYRNAFGYYVLAPGKTVSSVAALDKRILFPNASLRGSGGNLVSGDRVRIGAFPAGTRIGFFVVADGWNGSRVDTSGAKPMYFSRAALNPESDVAVRRHVAILLHQGTGKAVMGFEDLNRSTSGCDNDFNDVMFTVAWNPYAAVSPEQFVSLPGKTDSDKDGVPDNLDEFPGDPTRAYTRWFPAKGAWGVLAFEDLWPRSGDYDFNDLVARYSIKEVRSANLSAKEVELRVVPVAAGANIRSGLGFGLGMMPFMPESVSVRKAGVSQPGAFQRDPTNGEALIRLTRDVLGGFHAPAGGIINTRTATPRYASDTLWARMVLASPFDLPEPPYDPFLFKASDSSCEIHLPDRSPTKAMKRSLFRTKDDKTDSVKGIWYRDASRMPWGLNLSEDWAWPVEGVQIHSAYPRFRNWVASGGRSDLDWYLHPVAGRVIQP